MQTETARYTWRVTDISWTEQELSNITVTWLIFPGMQTNTPDTRSRNSYKKLVHETCAS